MEERAGESVVEAQAAGLDPSDPAAASMALALRKAPRSRRLDDKTEAFLEKQGRLIDLQTEHLHEQRELVLSRLRWGRFSDRMKALLQVMTGLAGLGALVLIAAMAWGAHNAHGLVIEAFSVPPELAKSGLTGQVAASRFLDKLQALQSATANSDRPAESYESNWGADFKVEIPETGLTFSEFDKLLRERLGHVSHVTGEVMVTSTGIAVTARTGDAPPDTFAGPAADFDVLAAKAAEAVYRESQPYRFTEYLEEQGRIDEALKVVSDLAVNGPRSERGWAYSKWAVMTLNDLGDAAAARRLAAKGLGYSPGSDINDRITLVNTEIWSGDEAADLAISRTLDREDQARAPDTSQYYYETNKRLGRAWLEFVEPDYLASGRDWMDVVAHDASAHFAALGPAMAATAYALGHDLPAARAAASQATREADPALAWDIATSAFRALPNYWIPAETGRWPEALADARAMDEALEAGKARRPIYGLMQRVWIWPLEAVAFARTGDVSGAQALVGKTPLDCYDCVRARGLIAAEQQDWPSSERWFVEAVRQAPSVAVAYAEWGRMRLARGDVRGAIAVLSAGYGKDPRFADTLELWGEALMAQGDARGAARKFADAWKLAPNWGRDHLKWGEALLTLGRREEGRVQLRAAAALDLTSAERAEAQALRL
jgi:tetratricopeptide (TPR) repeat protein